MKKRGGYRRPLGVSPFVTLRFCRLLCCVACALLPLRLEASPEAASPEAAPGAPARQAPETPERSGPRLPRLLAPPVAVYPADALHQGVEASVLLELDVDPEGAVVAARVVESAGMAHAFDTAARDALLSARFSPALDRKGRPTSATLQYRYAFSLEAAPVVSAEGQVRQAGTRRPLGDLRVVATASDTGETRVTTADVEGRFSFVGLQEGTQADVGVR